MYILRLSTWFLQRFYTEARSGPENQCCQPPARTAHLLEHESTPSFTALPLLPKPLPLSLNINMLLIETLLARITSY